MKVLKVFNIILTIFILVFSFVGTATAEFNISVTPYEGGTSLRFGRVDAFLVNKEVKIKISSTAGRQYQVFQRVIEPFVNERGERLNLEAITSYTLRGSNSSGTLYQEGPIGLSYADQLLYSSNVNGDSDSFRMIYTAHPDRLNISGNCFGKIIYTLQPIGATLQTYIFDVFLDASGEFNIEVKSSSGRDLLRLNTERDKKDYAVLSFKGNTRGRLNIYQEITQLPQNELKEEINQDCIQFFTSGGEGSKLYYTSPIPLEKKRLLLCSSDQEHDTFSVNFLLGEEEILSQKAGVYRGEVIYVIEGFGIQKTISLYLEIEVNPIFKMDVELPPEGLRFANLQPMAEPVSKEVTISVKTNLGKPYIVTQDMLSPLVNEEGKQFPAELFTMKEEIVGEGQGRLKFTDFIPVPLGKVFLFFSDDRGSPVQFKLIYRIKPTLSIHVGDYSVIINYSLEEK